MNLTFPTRPGTGKPGLPKRARACRCDHGQLLAEAEETCVRCGHYDEVTILATWRERAQAIARRNQAVTRKLAA